MPLSLVLSGITSSRSPCPGGTCECDLTWKQGICWSKQFEIGSYGVKWALTSVMGVFVKKKRGRTQGRNGTHEGGGGDCSSRATIKGPHDCQQHEKLGEAERFFPRTGRGSTASPSFLSSFPYFVMELRKRVQRVSRGFRLGTLFKNMTTPSSNLEKERGKEIH